MLNPKYISPNKKLQGELFETLVTYILLRSEDVYPRVSFRLKNINFDIDSEGKTHTISYRYPDLFFYKTPSNPKGIIGDIKIGKNNNNLIDTFINYSQVIGENDLERVLRFYTLENVDPEVENMINKIKNDENNKLAIPIINSINHSFIQVNKEFIAKYNLPNNMNNVLNDIKNMDPIYTKRVKGLLTDLLKERLNINYPTDIYNLTKSDFSKMKHKNSEIEDEIINNYQKRYKLFFEYFLLPEKYYFDLKAGRCQKM